MNVFSIILLLVLGGIGAFFLRKALRVFRVQANERIQPILPRLFAANADMRYLLDLERGYFSNYDRTKWLEDHNGVLVSIRELGFLARLVKPEDRKTIVEFQGYHSGIDYNRSKFNSELMRKELERYNEFFDDIEGRTLDRQQRETIITEEDNNLCIAGAGSGKTTTIVGKISYLLDRYKVDPKRILLISFTRKAADSLTSRVGVPNLKGYTFHKLGLDIITEVEGVRPAIFDEGQYRQFIEKKFQEYMSGPGTKEAFLDFFENQLKPYRSQFEFDTRSAYIQYLKDHNFETYKNITDNKGRIITNQRERVKSIEESKIANWLLFNGFSYVYEKPYEIDTRDKEHGQYKPDFYIEQNGRKVYIEHFGVNREFKVPPFFADGFNGDYEKANRSYNGKIRWAREIHSKNNSDLIETYSYQMHDGTLFGHLKRSLLALGFEIKPLSIDEKIEIIRRYASRELESIVELASTFIVLMKSNNRSFEELEAKLDESKIPYVKERGMAYLKLIKRIYMQYQELLASNNERDFSDLINDSVRYLNEGKCKVDYTHIIVDEFQDISIGRYKLLEAIRKQNPNVKIMGVGDDWQSIYRFAGSDIALFKDFEDYFGFTERTRIETTYRFHEPMISLSSAFVQKNPNQTPKALRGTSEKGKTNIKLLTSDTADDTDALEKVLRSLLNSGVDVNRETCKVISRYSHDIDRIGPENKRFRIDKDRNLIFYKYVNGGETREIVLDFLTIHKAKGLEADHVILLNANEGQYGFPAEMTDDPLLNLVLSDADQYENGEERRLFYVALTRARKNSYIISNRTARSKFIHEIEPGLAHETAEDESKCPECRTGIIVQTAQGVARNGSHYRFFGCSNYSYGCTYSRQEWS